MDLEEPGPEASATQWCREAETVERERKTEQPFGFSIFDCVSSATLCLCCALVPFFSAVLGVPFFRGYLFWGRMWLRRLAGKLKVAGSIPGTPSSECRGVPERDPSPLLLPTSWLSVSECWTIL